MEYAIISAICLINSSCFRVSDWMERSTKYNPTEKILMLRNNKIELLITMVADAFHYLGGRDTCNLLAKL